MPGYRNLSTTASDNCRAQVTDKRNALCLATLFNRAEFSYIVRKPAIGIVNPKVPLGVDRPPGKTQGRPLTRSGVSSSELFSLLK